MLKKNLDITNYRRNIQILITELFRIMSNLAPPFMNNMLAPRVNNCNLRNFQKLVTQRKKTVKRDLETVSYRCPQVCTPVPDTIRSSSSLIECKSKTRLWICMRCPWRL